MINTESTIKSRQESNNRSKSPGCSDRITVNLQLEVLDGCEFSCDGCYVNRRNDYVFSDIKRLRDLISEFDSSYELNEIVLGPTDLFGAKNTLQVINSNEFLSLFQKFDALTFNSTLQNEPSFVKEVLSNLERVLPPNVKLEMFVVLDLKKYLSKDRDYLDRLEENLQIMDQANILFAYNINTRNSFSKVDILELSKSINKTYNAHLKMAPSFFRSSNESIIEKALFTWRSKLKDQLGPGKNDKILFNMLDKNFGGVTYLNYTYKSGKIFQNPYIYDYIFDESENFSISLENLDLKNLLEFGDKKVIEQFEFAKDLECETCELLSSCVGRNVLSYMKNHQITDCFLPKQMIIDSS
jgi:hypothetical protein